MNALRNSILCRRIDILPIHHAISGRAMPLGVLANAARRILVDHHDFIRHVYSVLLGKHVLNVLHIIVIRLVVFGGLLSFLRLIIMMNLGFARDPLNFSSLLA